MSPVIRSKYTTEESKQNVGCFLHTPKLTLSISPGHSHSQPANNPRPAPDDVVIKLALQHHTHTFGLQSDVASSYKYANEESDLIIAVSGMLDSKSLVQVSRGRRCFSN